MMTRHIGPYELTDLIGKGGAAEVWRARRPGAGEEYAIKVLAKRWARHPTVRARFVLEATVLEQLSHPSIPRYVALLYSDETLAIVQELLLGITLAELLESATVLDGRRCVPWFIELLGAVAHAHAQGVIHRDLKPANILLHPDGVKLLDFGLARLPGGDRLTGKGKTVGTVQYISCEQARGEELDERSDLYSVGVSLYECLTGVQPFAGGAPAAVMERLLNETPTPPSEHWPIIDPALERLVLKAIRKKPGERFESAPAMASALEAWLRSDDQSTAR
jgi:eukaryotic-like serine/threonine-protein kinase